MNEKFLREIALYLALAATGFTAAVLGFNLTLREPESVLGQAIWYSGAIAAAVFGATYAIRCRVIRKAMIGEQGLHNPSRLQHNTD